MPTCSPNVETGMKPIVITAWSKEEIEASSCEEVGIESALSPLVPVLFLAVIQPPSISNSNALGPLNSNRSVSFNDSAPLSRPDFVVLAVLHQCTVARLLGHVECSKFSKKRSQLLSARTVSPTRAATSGGKPLWAVAHMCTN